MRSLFALLLLASSPALAWGPEAHRAIAEGAERALSTEARAELEPLLDGASLADVSTRLDERRGQADWAWASRLHYDNVDPAATSYRADRDCPGGRCAVVAVAHFAHVLADEERSLAERREALEFVVHLVGDLHQPLHVGYAADRGGNDHAVQHEVVDNLHALWDGPIGAAAARERLEIRPSAKSEHPAVWADESLDLTRSVVYDLPPNHPVPDWYLARSEAIARGRLEDASGALAGVLQRALTGQPLGFEAPQVHYERAPKAATGEWVGLAVALLVGLVGVGIVALVLRRRRRRDLLELYLSKPGFLALTVVAVLMTLAIDLALPVVYQAVFDEVVVPGRLERLAPIILAGTPALGMSILGQVLLAWAVPRLATAQMLAARLGLARAVLNAPAAAGRELSVSQTLSRFQADLPQIEQALVSAVPRVIRGSVTLLGAVGVMLWLDWRIAAIALVCLPIAAWLPRWLGRLARREEVARQTAEAEASGVLLDVLHGLDVVRAYALQHHFERVYAEGVGEVQTRTQRAASLGMLATSAANLGAVMVTIVILTLGTVVAVQVGISVGVLAAVGSLLALVGASVNRLGSAIPALSRASGSWRRVQELRDQVGDPPPARSSEVAPPPSDALEVRDVGFSHDGTRPHLEAIALSLEPGTSTALVGASGSGKSTLLGVITGELEPATGEIGWGEGEYRRLVRTYGGMVGQRPIVFSMSVADNIALGRLGAPRSEIEDAAKRAHIHEVIAALPQGYDTLIGTDRASLSGGQRQRIAIARALLRDPTLLILDEATSALDPASAGIVLDGILERRSDRMVLAVTHRLDVARRFDRIGVLDRGRLVDVADHDTLMERCGSYRSLQRHQGGLHVSIDGRAGTLVPERLQLIPLFADLPVAMLQDLASRISIERHADGDVVCREGETGDSLMLIARGQLDIFDADGALRSTADSGDVVGEIALLRGGRRSATLVSRGQTTLFLLSKAALDAVVPADHPLRDRLERLADARLARDAEVS